MQLAGAYAMWQREVLRFVRDRTRIVISIAQPLLYIVVFGSGVAELIASATRGAVNYGQFTFAGAIVMAVIFTAVTSALSIVWDRRAGFLKAILVTPVSRTAVALGKIAGSATAGLLQGLVLLPVAALLGFRLHVDQLLVLVGLMLLLALMMGALGLVLAAWQRTFEGFQMLLNFLLMPMFFLSGAFFPLQAVPPWMRWLSRVDPLTFAVDGIRTTLLRYDTSPDALRQIALRPVASDAALMGALTIGFALLAVGLFRREDGR